jgi:hypothetical protein
MSRSACGKVLLVGVLLGTTGAAFQQTLPAGRYQLTAAKGGFVTLQHGQRRPLEPGRPLLLANGQTLIDVNFALPRGSVITGRVLDPFGDTVTGASAQVHCPPATVGNGVRARPA